MRLFSGLAGSNRSYCPGWRDRTWGQGPKLEQPHTQICATESNENPRPGVPGGGLSFPGLLAPKSGLLLFGIGNVPSLLQPREALPTEERAWVALCRGNDGEVRLAVMVVLAVVAEEPLCFLFGGHWLMTHASSPTEIRRTIELWIKTVSITRVPP